MNFIDLGQTIKLSDSFVNGILYLVNCKLNGEKYCSYSFFVALGFDQEKLKALSSKLDLVLEIIFEPLFTDYAFDLNDWNYKRDLDLLLGDDKWWFRSAGGTEFFLFMKSFMGVKNLIAKLEVNLFYKQILKDILSVNKFNSNQFQILKSDNTEINSYSEKIKILVLDNNKEKVKLTIPFMAIFELESYFNEDVKRKIQEKKINIHNVVQEALEDGGKPKEFFHLEFDQKIISISME